MGKICLIRQPAGLGDIFFLQKVGHVLKSKGYDVIWPVIPEFTWIRDYITDFTFPTIDDDYPYKDLFKHSHVIENDEVLYLPIQDADRMFRDKIMACKYRLVGLDYDDWVNYFNFTRNQEKEDHLFYETLGIKDGEEYCLVSRNYGSPPHSEKFNMNCNTDLRIIEVDYYEGVTLLDWCKVIENATEMCIIDSSINFIIDKLKPKCKINMWSRRPNNWSEINYIFKTEYNLMN
tara:strand:+ start:4245 stop:4943 length:699 start_codon:yes stop_codon:yes gene_type:complete